MSGIEKRLAFLKWCEEIDRKLVTHYNHSIRWARKMIKQYGDVGENVTYSAMVHDNLRSRAKVKASMSKRADEIKLYERFEKLA